MSVKAHKENLEFQTEVTQLLDLMIHSLYSNKEIFLRELISNAADACDKLRFEALSDDALFEDDTELQIRVSYDKDKHTLTISDNGIGMSRSEVIDNIGTIAKSGTQEFFKQLTGDQQKDAHLIGQFGVGFYSSFIVADKVTLETRRAGTGPEHGVQWTSDGKGSYELETIEKPGRGTEITLHLKKGEEELADGFRLRAIIHKYSDHITLPIVMWKEAVPGGEEDKDNKKKEPEDETVNQASALWAKPKSEIKDEEYKEFYKHVGHDFEDPLAWSHSRIEGKQEYISLLYIPQRAPFDLWDQTQRHGIKLYTQRVFIMEDVEKLMPHYLRFVRGIIDSSDLPLNISREILQHSKDIEAIKSGSTKKVLHLLESIAKDKNETYQNFWQEFGRVLKEGVVEDMTNQEQIAKLLRFASTHTDTDAETTSLEDYIGRMQKDQDKIYYVTADTFNAAKNSPHLEIFRKKGVEVLLLHDRIDEWLVNQLTKFQDKELHSVARGSLDLGTLADKEEKQEQEKVEKESEDIVKKIKDALGEKIKDARVTHRLTDSPACLVADDQDLGMNMERILKAMGQDAPAVKPILEINPTHPLVKQLKSEDNNDKIGEWSNLLFDQALLSEGGKLDDPAGFVQRLNKMLLELTLSSK